MKWKIGHHWWGSNPRSLYYIPSSVNSCHVLDHQSNASHIYFYISGAPAQEIVYESDKNTNWICPMTAILNFTICGTTMSLTAWHTAEMDSAQKIPIESIYEVLFLKNAYRSLSRAIFQFFVLTICVSDTFIPFLCLFVYDNPNGRATTTFRVPSGHYNDVTWNQECIISQVAVCRNLVQENKKVPKASHY